MQMQATTSKKACAAVWKATCDIVGNEDAPVDEHASLFDLGIDSLGLAELVIQLEECYGEGCVTIDDVIANPIVKHIAAKLPSGEVETACAPTATSADAAPRAIFLFAGEGAHSAGLDLTVLKTSPSWPTVDGALREQHGLSADEFLGAHLGNHAPPYSPVVTTVLNLLQADLWKLWNRKLSLHARRAPFSAPPLPRALGPARAERVPSACRARAERVPSAWPSVCRARAERERARARTCCLDCTLQPARPASRRTRALVPSQTRPRTLWDTPSASSVRCTHAA